MIKFHAAQLKAKGSDLFETGSAKSKRFASDRCVQVTAASLVGGSTVLGADIAPDFNDNACARRTIPIRQS